jgi:hypothetical protein
VPAGELNLPAAVSIENDFKNCDNNIQKTTNLYQIYVINSSCQIEVLVQIRLLTGLNRK